jgi:hypothetical protein
MYMLFLPAWLRLGFVLYAIAMPDYDQDGADPCDKIDYNKGGNPDHGFVLLVPWKVNPDQP